MTASLSTQTGVLKCFVLKKKHKKIKTKALLLFFEKKSKILLTFNVKTTNKITDNKQICLINN